MIHDASPVECLSVIQALQAPSEEYQTTTYPLTSDQLWLILNVAEQTRLLDIRAKFWFDEQAARIIITSPTRSIHETLVGDLVAMMRLYIVGLPIPRRRLLLRGIRHTSLHDAPQVLDFQLRLSNLRRLTRMELWMGECGYRLHRAWMKKKLVALAQAKPSVQFAFIIDINQVAYRPPPENGMVAKHLRAQPMLDIEAFLPESDSEDRVDDSQPIVAHGWTWAELKEIRYTLCFRSPSGMFDFDGPDSAYTAHGTLFPLIDMSKVDQLLEVARVQLNDTVADHLESQKVVNASIIESMRRHSSRFEYSWEETRDFALASWRKTAHERYVSWYRRETHSRL